MNYILIFCLFFNVVCASEYYCMKGDTAKWEDVEKFMNNPDSPAEYKFDPSLHSTFASKCAAGDIVIVRRMKVTIDGINKFTSARFLSILEGKDVDEFAEKGGICHQGYDKYGGVKEVDFSGSGDLTEKRVLHSCGYRESSCGEEEYQRHKKFDIWCRYNLHSKKWTTLLTRDKPVKMNDDQLICEMESNEKATHSILCLKGNCSSIEVGSKLNKVCNEEKKTRKRLYSYTKTASTWGREAFKHFFRNYVITLIFYCYFMLQARRMPMIRYELSPNWKKFKSAIDPKDDDETNPVDGAKRRERFLYERCKREFDRKGQLRVKKVAIEHMQEELKAAKDGISKMAALVKEEDGESASNRPPHLSAGTKLLPREPCTAAELRDLIQWSWIVESQMVKSMNDDDNGSELCKFYGLEVKQKISKL